MYHRTIHYGARPSEREVRGEPRPPSGAKGLTNTKTPTGSSTDCMKPNQQVLDPDLRSMLQRLTEPLGSTIRRSMPPASRSGGVSSVTGTATPFPSAIPATNQLHFNLFQWKSQVFTLGAGARPEMNRLKLDYKGAHAFGCQTNRVPGPSSTRH